MSFGSNVTPPRFGAGAHTSTPTWEANIRKAGLPIEYLKEGEVEPDPEPVPDLPITWNDVELNDCYRCGHRGNNPVPGCECCAREHHYAPPDPED